MVLGYQQQFIESFLRENSPSHHLLVAPPGTGKTHTACVIVEQLSKIGKASRVLVIAASVAVRHQWAARLNSIDSPRAVSMDRQAFRELEASVPLGRSPWNSAPWVVIGIPLLRHLDVYEALAAESWDLVIVDECERLRIVGDSRSREITDGAVFIKHLAEQKKASRILLMTTQYRDRARILPDVEVTEWKVPLPAYHAIDVTYEPGSDEKEFVEELERFLDSELVTTSSRPIRFLLMRQAESSIFCIEPQLQNWIDKIEHADKDVLPTDDYLEDASERVHVDQIWRNRASAIAGLRSLKSNLDSVRSDVKLDVLTGLLHNDLRESGAPPRICIVTSMNRTAWYLQSALESEGINALRLEPYFNPGHVSKIIEQFASQGGVLIAGPSGLRGFEFPEVRSVVIYEPLSKLTMDRVLGRFDRLRRTTTLKVFVMRRERRVRSKRKA